MLETVFLIGALLFAASSMYFYFTSPKDFNTSLYVSLVTLVSYVIMHSGDYTVSVGDTTVYYTRWVFYGLSCALLMYEIAKRLKKNGETTANMLYATVLVMGTGALAAITTDQYQIFFFLISSVVYVMLLRMIFSAKANPYRRQLKAYVGLGWTLFPLVFVLSPTMFGVISLAVAQAAYLALDAMTKIAFYVTTSK
jgi:sensory rhodopsin